jgi:hypothetical protein
MFGSTVKRTVGMESINIEEDEQRIITYPLWQQINEDGFGNSDNRGPRGMEIFNNSLIIGVANFNNNSAFVLGKSYQIHQVLYEILKYVFFCRNHLKSDGCEIWCYNDESGWKQLVGNKHEAIMKAGFGNKNNSEVGMLIGYNGYLYAGLRNRMNGCQIWRTKSISEEWEMVAENGLGNKNNIWCMEACIFDGGLYVGTYNEKNGCEIFRTYDGKTWNCVVGEDSIIKSGFGTKDNFYAWSMCVYDSCLYVGTDNRRGCELWKTSDGITWKPVVAYEGPLNAKLHGAAFPRGFGKRFLLGGIRRMIVYNNELYLCMIGGVIYANFFGPNFRKFLTISTPSNPFIKLAQINRGASVWKYNSSNDKWMEVVGGKVWRNRKIPTSGFGDPKNLYFWSIEIYNNHLYIGTGHLEPIDIVLNRTKFLKWNLCAKLPKGQGEIWRYDGENWEQINIGGFGDEYNVGIREMKVYNNILIAATMNVNTGCEVWKNSLF